jgi:uncharacterized membrane protein YccC
MNKTLQILLGSILVAPVALIAVVAIIQNPVPFLAVVALLGFLIGGIMILTALNLED